MAEILLKGGKMLNKSCPKCNAPLFQYQGRTFCAKCGWEEGKASEKERGDEAAKAKEETAKEKRGGKPSEEPARPATVARGEPWRTLDEVQQTVLEKIRTYSKTLSESEVHDELEANIDALSSLLSLLERILEMRKKRA